MSAADRSPSPPSAAATGRPRVSRRIGGIAESATLAVDAKAKALKAAGRPVIGFGAGEPDFPTPGLHRRGGGRGVRRDPANHRYTPAGGPARAAGGDRGEDRCATPAYEVAPEQVLVTNGGKQAVYQAFATLLDPGDEVLLPAPYWTTYPEAIRLAGGVPVEVFADEDQGYLVTVEQLEAARTPRTKVLLFCSPSNPTGAVYPPEQVRAIGAVGARARHLGRSPTRSTSTSSTTARAFASIVGRGARARRHRASSSTASPRPTR